MAMLFILPQFGAIAMMVGSSGVLSVYVLAIPDHFRSRKGSMTLAISLVTAMWVATAVITVLTLLGEIQN